MTAPVTPIPHNSCLPCLHPRVPNNPALPPPTRLHPTHTVSLTHCKSCSCKMILWPQVMSLPLREECTWQVSILAWFTFTLLFPWRVYERALVAPPFNTSTHERCLPHNSPKSVRLWGVRRDHTGSRLVGRIPRIDSLACLVCVQFVWFKCTCVCETCENVIPAPRQSLSTLLRYATIPVLSYVPDVSVFLRISGSYTCADFII